VYVCLDINILLSISGFNNPDSDTSKALRDTLYKKNIRIPQIVLGEALTKIISNKKKT